MTVIASQGNRTAVFRFKMYDINSNQFITSRRYATMRTIEQLHAIQAGPSIEVPHDAVDGDGFTAIDYDQD
jgi:hypothetical protein